MKTREFSISTDYEGMYNITARLREVIRESGVQSGLAVVYCPHTTAGITINENADRAHRGRQAHPRHLAGRVLLRVRRSAPSPLLY